MLVIMESVSKQSNLSVLLEKNWKEIPISNSSFNLSNLQAVSMNKKTIRSENLVASPCRKNNGKKGNEKE